MSEQSVGFEIQPVIEQKPFENQAVQNFFEEWCAINDHIKPVIVDRDEWEEREDILEKKDDGISDLYIPKDLQLWEMVGIMEAVDVDTFGDKPERQYEAKQKMVNLGETFKDTGVYIAQRLGAINEGKGIAETLAEQLFNYGESLVTGEKADKSKKIDDISGMELTFKETQNVDRLLAGNKLYESREGRVKKEMRGRIANRGNFYEEERQKTLTQFFRVSQKAFELQERSRRGELKKVGNGLEPWLSDISTHEGFIGKVEKKITQEIEKPRAELGESIFRRGMDLLAKYMPLDELTDYIKSNYFNLQNWEKTLRESLQLDTLKIELDWLRSNKSVSDISKKEREIADKIQEAVNKFPYDEYSDKPLKIMANREINCVGASILAGALMQEVGLSYLVGSVPEHSILFLVTADGQVEWRDIFHPENNGILTDEEIEGRKDNGKLLTVADIVSFSKDPKPEGLIFDIKGDEYRKRFTWINKGKRQSISIFGPEYGQKIATLGNLTHFLIDQGKFEEAAEAGYELVRLNPLDAFGYIELSRALRRLNRNDEVVDVCRNAIKIDSKNSAIYLSLAISLKRLGRMEEAIKTYQEFVNLADGLEYFKQVEQVKKIIASYKEKEKPKSVFDRFF